MANGRRGSSKGRPGWCVYFLRCRDGSLYAGATNDLPRRLALHAAGKGARYTRSHLPVALAWTERARGRSAALRREAALKRLTRAEKLALIARPATPSPSRSPSRRGAQHPPAPSRRGAPR